MSSFVRTFFGCFKRDACEREESLLATNRCTFGVFNIFRQFCGVLLRRIFSTKRRRAKALAGRRHFSSGDIPVTVADYIQRQIEILENAEEASKRKALLDNESVEDLLVDERRFSLHEGSETSFKEYRQKSAQTAPQLYDKSQSVQPTGFAATSMRRFSGRLSENRRTHVQFTERVQIEIENEVEEKNRKWAAKKLFIEKICRSILHSYNLLEMTIVSRRPSGIAAPKQASPKIGLRRRNTESTAVDGEKRFRDHRTTS